MTNGRETKSERFYTLTWLPWALGFGVLALYLLTGNRNLSFLSDWAVVQQLPMGVRSLGWYYGAEFLTPVYYAVTLPLRLLPPQFIPLALNVFSALCGALALGQLARSVALLPQDRTRDQREHTDSRNGLLTISLAWLPSVLAVTVCGLGLTFWEQGTNGTGEMFDLLLFSYILRCFLEYRLDEKEARLFRAALVYGLTITNNPAMIAFFPIFVGALVWTRKLQFFNLRFLGRMTLCGLIGLLFYLLLPTIGSLSPNQTGTFWELLQANLTSQKWVLTSFPRITLLLLSLTTLLPVFLLSIKWSSQFGDPSRIGVAITNTAFHLCHLVILLACLWMSLDPGFSPRKVAPNLPFPCNNLTFLPLYYLAALSIGYYSGYLLLVSRAIGTRSNKPTPLARLLQRVTTCGLFLLLLAAPAILIHRNFPQIRLTNGPLQSQFAANLAAGLPESGFILSDDPRRLWILQEWLTKQSRAKNFTFVCTAWLQAPPYQKFLHRKFPKWIPPALTDDKTPISQEALLSALVQMGKENKIAYLHPSFGYYFESFFSQPSGLGCWLVLHQNSELVPPPQSPEVIARNKTFWDETAPATLKQILPVTVPPDVTHRMNALEKFYNAIGLKQEKNQQTLMLGSIYSRSLVNWAVELQKTGDYESAAAQLKLAQQLNPKNVVAEINLAFNEKHHRGGSVEVEFTKAIDEYFGESRSWEQVLTLNGPYDDPSLSFAQGYVFVQGNLIRQAAQAFDRTRVQATNDITSRLWLGQLNLNRNFPDRTLDMIREVREIAARVPGMSTNITDLFTLEAAAHLAKKEDAIATTIIETNLANHPGNFDLLASACKTYADNARHTNALAITERMLVLAPENAACWLNKGCFLVELASYPEAIKAFDRVLTIETNNYTAILYRAIASLRADKLDDAVKDYEVVQRQFPKAFQVDYGLGEIAYRRRDTNAAISHYESYLKNAPPKTAEANLISERLDELKGVKPKAAGQPALKAN